MPSSTIMRANILLVDDEPALLMTVGDRLRKEGYAVECATDGDEGFEKATRFPFDVIILDVMLPRRSGFIVCQEIRQAGIMTPVLMLTARSQTLDKVLSLKLGADDYVTKPFHMVELMARIEALLRRAPSNSTIQADSYRFGSIVVDLQGTSVLRGDQPVNLSAREFQLLRYLIGHPGVTISRDELLKEVWGYSKKAFTRTVDVHVASLRIKLENDPRQPKFILTVQKLGYKFQP